MESLIKPRGVERSHCYGHTTMNTPSVIKLCPHCDFWNPFRSCLNHIKLHEIWSLLDHPLISYPGVSPCFSVSPDGILLWINHDKSSITRSPGASFFLQPHVSSWSSAAPTSTTRRHKPSWQPGRPGSPGPTWPAAGLASMKWPWNGHDMAMKLPWNVGILARNS